MGEEEKTSFKSVFGKDIAEIPCFRDSYFYGILSGIAGGLGYFMFTSRAGKATHFGFGSFCISTLSYWSYCRWKQGEKTKQGEVLQKVIEEYASKQELTTENDVIVSTV